MYNRQMGGSNKNLFTFILCGIISLPSFFVWICVISLFARLSLSMTSPLNLYLLDCLFELSLYLPFLCFNILINSLFAVLSLDTLVWYLFLYLICYIISLNSFFAWISLYTHLLYVWAYFFQLNICLNISLSVLFACLSLYCTLILRLFISLQSLYVWVSNSTRGQLRYKLKDSQMVKKVSCVMNSVDKILAWSAS